MVEVARKLLVLLLLVLSTPPGAELVEWTSNWLGGGEFWHADDEHHAGGPCYPDDDGCSGLCMLCSCHPRPASTPQGTAGIVIAPPSLQTTVTLPVSLVAGRDADPPPHRPPIA